MTPTTHAPSPGVHPGPLAEHQAAWVFLLLNIALIAVFTALSDNQVFFSLTNADSRAASLTPVSGELVAESAVSPPGDFGGGQVGLSQDG